MKNNLSQLCQIKFVDLIETNNFANLRFFLFHILLLKMNFFKLKKKYTSHKKIL